MVQRSLNDLLLDELGTSTRPIIDPENNSIGTSVVPLLKQDPNRIAFSVVNLSDNTIYIAPFIDVAASKGFRLGPGGGAAIAHYKEAFHLVGYDWYVVANGSSSTIMTVAIVTT